MIAYHNKIATNLPLIMLFLNITNASFLMRGTLLGGDGVTVLQEGDGVTVFQGGEEETIL